MLWTIIVILIVLWLLGFIGHFGGGLIHLLLVIAVVILIINLLQGRRGLLTNALPNCCRGGVSPNAPPFTGVPSRRELLKSKESIRVLRSANSPSPSYRARPAAPRLTAELE